MEFNRIKKLFAPLFILFLFFFNIKSIVYAANCTITLNPPPVNDIYYSNTSFNITASIDGSGMQNAENVKISFYNSTGASVPSCPSLQTNLSSANTGISALIFSCNIQNIPDDSYFVSVDSTVGVTSDGNCKTGLICIYNDPNKTVCSNSSVGTAVPQGGCSNCGFCDRNQNKILDPSEIPSYYNDCKSCIDPAPMGRAGSWTALGCIDSTPGGLIAWFLEKMIYIAGGIAFLVMLYGVFTIIISSGNPEKLNTGKDYITSAVAGLALIIFSVFLLKVLGVDILGIPNFKL